MNNYRDFAATTLTRRSIRVEIMVAFFSNALHSGSADGPIVTHPRQARRIAESVANKAIRTRTEIRKRAMVAGGLVLPDVSVESHGNIFLFRPNTDRGRNWLTENVSDDAQWFGPALMVEHRYARELASGLIGEGLKVA